MPAHNRRPGSKYSSAACSADVTPVKIPRTTLTTAEPLSRKINDEFLSLLTSHGILTCGVLNPRGRSKIDKRNLRPKRKSALIGRSVTKTVHTMKVDQVLLIIDPATIISIFMI
ncbi:unnamed protein product [Didymodactylos carnosus]|uniref:Uncharacterized protein n=1 Tax=Didymodactylos carnosus TaxID=1234261 RepID=A0A8S2E628_9BILA|nr:unnamed protein product [Didymodactylos carnosus]CAF3824288.1 unnamed protein product [Didymodactylos carnosus]